MTQALVFWYVGRDSSPHLSPPVLRKHFWPKMRCTEIKSHGLPVITQWLRFVGTHWSPLSYLHLQWEEWVYCQSIPCPEHFVLLGMRFFKILIFTNRWLLRKCKWYGDVQAMCFLEFRRFAVFMFPNGIQPYCFSVYKNIYSHCQEVKITKMKIHKINTILNPPLRFSYCLHSGHILSGFLSK